MIATILTNSKSFSAVDYNEERCKRGEGELLCAENFGDAKSLFTSMADYKNYLKKWSERNTRIKQAQLHVSISAKGKSMSKEELMQAGKDWLNQMGYGDNPYLMYFHKNTKNNHIHIITTRINREGTKISDAFEKRRSLKIIDALSKTNRHEELRQLAADKLRYGYANAKQFALLMERAGCTVKESGNVITITRAGTTLDINMDLILFCQKRYYKKILKDEKKKLKSIFNKYSTSMSREDFCSYIRTKIGCDIYFFGNTDSPYGYAIIDNKKRRVLSGKDILPIKELLENFKQGSNRKEYFNSMIKQIVKENPGITRKDINKKLLKLGAYIKGDDVLNRWGKKEKICTLDENISKTIQNNNKKKYIIDNFNPTSQIELLWIEKNFGIKLYMNDIKINQKEENDINYYKQYINWILSTDNPKNEFIKQQLWVYRNGNEILFFDDKNNKIITGNDIGINIEYFSARMTANEKEDNSIFIDMNGDDRNYPDAVEAAIQEFISIMESGQGGGGNNDDPVRRNRKKKKKQGMVNL